MPAQSPTFEPPGPGSWGIDATHMPRPLPRFHLETFPEPFVRGFRTTTSRYGILLDYLEPGIVHGFVYYNARPVAREEAPARFEAAEQALASKLWRTDLAEWDRTAKPASVAAHLSLQGVEPAALGRDDLLGHLARCREHVSTMIFQHHRFNGAAFVPVCDFLAHAQEWTGEPKERLLDVFRGYAPESGGRTPELRALADAIRRSPEAASLVAGDDPPGAILDALLERPDVAPAARAYLDRVGYRLVDGFDISNPYALEQPEALVATIRAAASGANGAAGAEDVAERTAQIRDAVPDADRAAFDELLEEARTTYRLRDERGLYSDVWASGIARRAVLAAGRLLADEGVIDEPEHLTEASFDEMVALLRTGAGVEAGELAERARFRRETHAVDAPPHLGDPPAPPPPADGLPPAAARVARAVDLFVSSLFGDSTREHGPSVIRGLPGSPGVHEGAARIVHLPEQFSRIAQGDVLVTHSTSEAFNTLLPRLGAIVSDSGGALSHAAIVAREYGIPAVVGTREATRLIADGARVRVDGQAGEVRLLR
jgi:rifampicin phosphotransferase